MDNLNFDETLLKKRIKERILLRMNTLNENLRDEDPNNSKLQPLIDHHNIMEVQYYSHRKFLGKVVIICKKVVKKLMYPVLMKQIHFNQRVIDQLYVVDQMNNNLEQKINEMTHGIIDSVVDEVTTVIRHISDENHENHSRLEESLNKLTGSLEGYQHEIDNKLNYYQNEVVVSLQESQNELDNKMHAYQKKNDEVIISNGKLKIDMVTSLLDELADLEQSSGNYERSYHLLLLAQRNSPDDLELEKKLMQSFERMIRSRNG
jgi:signal transduction histidine kinase